MAMLRNSIQMPTAEKTPLLGSAWLPSKSSSAIMPGTKKAKQLLAKDQWLETRRRLAVTTAAGLWLTVGVTYLMTFQGFDFIEALYLSVQLITTVGYGDFVVKHDLQVFMAFYLLGCIILVAFAVSQYFEAMQEMSTEFLRLKMRDAERRMGVVRNEDHSISFGRFHDLVISAFFFFLMVSIGTCFYKAVEPCSCVDAFDHPLPNCKIGLQCRATGGHILTWTNSFYLSVVTLTTCGFGDFHPHTKKGMAFACVWIVVGCAATANFIRAFVGYFCISWNKHYVLDEKITGEVFDEIDEMDGAKDGKISRDAYKLYVLKRFRLVDSSILDELDKQFDLFDTRSREDGIVSYKTMERIYLEDDDTVKASWY